MLEVLPKQFFGYKWGGRLTLETKLYTYHQNTFCGALSVTIDCSVHSPKQLKSTRCGNFTPPLPWTLKAACLNFSMWGRVLDVINHAKCQLDRFRGFGAPSDRKSLSPIDWRYRPY